METPPFTCPYCDTVLQLPEDAWYYTCPHCNNRLDLKSQFAYLRGLDAFSEGQEIMQKLTLRKRQAGNPQFKAAMALFMEAYSSIQVAFQANLADAQRSLGTEMMSSMATEFMKRNMVSNFEMSYWQSLMVERTAQNEYDGIKEKLTKPGGLLSALKRARLRARQKQLLNALADVDRKLKILEKNIDFVDIPRARNDAWKP